MKKINLFIMLCLIGTMAIAQKKTIPAANGKATKTTIIIVIAIIIKSS
jgi:hypothetical protein